ncbi:PaaI family thioesterase [Phenylobacterium sp.]|uniref:PaaI family thioesterase n=1 Tax=Phenylobacterium sp. TaxID=1871053 RepID=UPI0011FCF1CE|nr:PaaI family thioesterase [Phenylobacterium sp.]THD62974.1 MAG: PaaI family thioesterase [Phenylobacterium sp.]
MSRAPEDGQPQPAAPDGYVPAQGRGGFSTLNGPYFHRLGDGPLSEQAFFALPRHANGLGLVHGGMLSAFMDGVLAGAVWRGAGKTAVTIHLSIDFLHMARVGEWVMGEAKMTRATREVAFAEGRAYVGGHDVVRCSGVFKLMSRDR